MVGEDGFEPPEALGPPDLQSGAFNHSATHRLCIGGQGLEFHRHR